MIVAAATVAFSLRRLGDDAWRYGSRWDATISFNGGNGDQAVAAAQRLSAISQAGVIREQDGRVDGRPLNVVAVEGVKGSQAAAWTAVVDGRAPQTDAEAALGGKSMRELHVRLGDTVTVQVSDAVAPRRLKVVGQVELNDGSRLDTGDGVLVSPAVLAPVRNTSFDALVVRLRPGTSPQQGSRPGCDGRQRPGPDTVSQRPQPGTDPVVAVGPRRRRGRAGDRRTRLRARHLGPLEPS